MDVVFLYSGLEGFENQLQLPGGQLIAAGLDGGNTIIFCLAENANKSLLLRHKRKPGIR